VRLSHHHDVDVVTGTLEEYVANIAAYHIALNAQPVGRIANLMEYLLV
jgi:hypothetical protein